MTTTTMARQYDPSQTEDRLYRFWEAQGYFHPEPDADGEPFTIVIPPPNVTGALHMGHALNNTLQDILVRWRRMQGRNALWVPGTDHAGIATQNVVERQLAQEGTSRHELGREAFIRRVWQWKEEYGNRILSQLKRLGSSCDWQRERFTMDAGLSRAVREAFVRFAERGLIYRDKYLINWCPRCHTALADDEVEHEEVDSHLWHIRYPYEDGSGHVVIATTRPETMLGDTAVAVHPDDQRYAGRVGQHLVLPEVGRKLPIIADHYVDPSFGTGALKVTPAHDPNDFLIGQRHELETINALEEDGTISEAGGAYAGMDRFACREALVEALQKHELIEKIEPYKHAVGHCYRCHTVVEPYLSDQWFVRTRDLAEAAIAATEDGRVTFHPADRQKQYLDWLGQFRDWCISRQLWWGHRIPVWYCEDCAETIVAREDPTACPTCGGSSLKQDPDVLDTWFSSSLWPFSTMGWPEPTDDLKTYYPTDVLITDRGIIGLWVGRMVMMGLALLEEVSFSDVYIHGTILDEIGRRMSKSLGNGIDPIDMIETYGADAVRFSLIMLTTEGQDVRLAESRFEMGRNFCNKLWNASRFVLMNLEGYEPVRVEAEALALEDRWILSRLAQTVHEVTAALEEFKFNEAGRLLYTFTWREMCDWYLEMIKPRLRDEAARPVARHVLAHLLDQVLRLLHPLVPFITEAIWEALAEVAPSRGLPDTLAAEPACIIAHWPLVQADHVDAEVEGQIAQLQEVIRGIRNIRADFTIDERAEVPVLVRAPEPTAAWLKQQAGYLANLAGVSSLQAGPELTQPPTSASQVFPDLEVYVPLAGLIDTEAEIARQRKTLNKLQGNLKGVDGKLANEQFLAKAPAHVVGRQRELREELQIQIERVQRVLESLGG